MSDEKINVLGEELQECSCRPLTGFYRDGYCRTGYEDQGIHTVCVEVSDEFLLFSKKQGNDLTTPVPAYNFPGLKAGDHWCLCAARWLEAYNAGVPPKVNLKASHVETLAVISLEALKKHAI